MPFFPCNLFINASKLHSKSRVVYLLKCFAAIALKNPPIKLFLNFKLYCN